MTKYPDLMVDIEGLGVSEGSIISSIAARPFNIKTGETSEATFNNNINIISAEKAGFTMDARAVLWWLNQSKEAIGLTYGYTEYCQVGMNIKHCLFELTKFVRDNCTSDVRIWQHTNYDAKLLQAAYDKLNVEVFYTHRSWKDIRTLVELTEGVIFDSRNYTAHYAMDDVDMQIDYCVKRYSQLNKGK